jgi:hypothetical protein
LPASLFAQAPESVGECGIDRPRSDAELLGRVSGNGDGDVAVLAVNTSQSVKLVAGGTPNAGCRALFGGLQVSVRVNDGATLVVDGAGITKFVGRRSASFSAQNAASRSPQDLGELNVLLRTS